MSEAFTILDEGRATSVEAEIADGRVLLSPDGVERALGWTLTPDGFCREATCVPVREGSNALPHGGVDLSGLGELLDRPVALDLDERAAAVGASAHERAMALRTLDAPDFTLPDLDGTPHSLSDFRGKKVFLAVWASW